MASFLNTVIGMTAALGIGAVMVTKLVDRSHGTAGPQATRATPVADSRSSKATGSSPPAAFGTVTLDPGRGGHYVAEVEIHGRRMPMMVDTGASIIALTDEDARAIGVKPMSTDYVIAMSTANGSIKAAPVMLREVRIRNISVPDVRAVVMPRGAMDQSLLGMSFLSRLRGYEVASGRLILRN